MKKPMRLIPSAFTALSCMLLPFVVAFDYPDTTGVRGKVSIGRGTYSLTSCSRTYQSEYVEENVALRATFATGSEGATWGKRLQPDQTTVGAYGNWAQEELLLVRKEGGMPETPPPPKHDNGASFGAYAQFDWRLFGLQVGAMNLSQWDTGEETHFNQFLPSAEVRVGPENMFASAAVLSSTPIQSGGGMMMGGVGGRIGDTRIWGGLSALPSRKNSLSLKVSRKIGPVFLGFAGQWAILKQGAMDVSNYDANHEHGLSLSLDIPLSKAW